MLATTRHLIRLSLGALVLAWGWGTTVHAVYQPSQLPDPSRRWAASLSLRSGYDDNINSNPQREGSGTSTIEPRLYLNIPLEQTFIGLRYTYGVTFFWDRVDENYDQSHVADLLISHRFTPRLTLNIDDSMRRGIEPELVETVGGVAEIRRGRGDYWFNVINAGLTWNASRRWLVNVGESWETWSYDVKQAADDNDRNTYTTSVGSTYTIDPISSVGLNFRYAITRYDKSGLDDERDVDSQSIFASYTRLFSPQLTAQVAAGASFSQFGNNDADSSPYFSLGLTYAYLPESSISFNSTYAFASSDGLYRSTDTVASTLQISHRLTRKWRVSAGLDYIHRQYQNPTTAFSYLPDENEDSVRARAAASYWVNRWLSVDLSYVHERIWSDVSGTDYYRNRVNAGLRLTF